MCTPSRGALLTGKYPIHTGLQHYVIAGSQPYGLPLSDTTLAQHLQAFGYSTHAVGKWHLGFFKKNYLPENRGFDTHFGYYLGKGDYFDHYSDDGGFMGLDLHENGKPVWNQSEVYSTDLFTERATSIILSHDQAKPLFLYLAYQSVHAGNEGDLIQAPQKYINRFPQIKNIKRKMFAGVVSALDDSIGQIMDALASSGMASNTVLVFSTDNGGPANGYDGNAACNWPLRGTKNTLWQGGVRGVGLVHSPLLKKKGYVNENLMHIVDWLPTIMSITTGNTSSLDNIDGINQWEVISENATTSRKEVLLNIDPINKNEGIIVGDFKVIFGDISDGKNDGWYPPSQDAQDFFYFSEFNFTDIPSSVSFIPQRKADFTNIEDLITSLNTEYELLQNKKHGLISTLNFKSNSDVNLQSSQPHIHQKLKTDDINVVSQHINIADNNNPASHQINCGVKPENASVNCQPEKAPCLYHLRDDPCEYHNLAPTFPGIVKQLMLRLEVYRRTMIPPANKPIDPNGNPQLHGGVWTPWL
ncbi:arylsulfatase J-like isoform X2 [Physella acuta]|nr:arylsulfatase J-like isoform X2 [Physella acuta]